MASPPTGFGQGKSRNVVSVVEACCRSSRVATAYHILPRSVNRRTAKVYENGQCFLGASHPEAIPLAMANNYLMN